MEKARRSTAGWTRWRPRAPGSAPASTSASTITGRQLRDRYDAVVLAIGATVAARPAGRRAASSTASTRRWSSCRRPTGPRSASRSSDQILATGKHVVDHRRRRHRRRLPRHRAPPGRRARSPQLEIMPQPERRARPTASRGRPTRCSTASRAPTRRAASGSTPSPPRSSSATRTATSGRCGWSRSSAWTARLRAGRGHRARDPGRSWCSRHGLHRSASTPVLVEQLGVELDERGNVTRDKHFMTLGPGRLRRRRRRSRPVAHRLGDRRGPAPRPRRRRLPHRLEPTLPAPITPTDRPLTV